MQYLNFGRFAKQTPQTEPIPGSTQVKNNAGGFGWAVDDTTRLNRFLILGAATGTYYVGQRELAKQNLDVVERMLKEGRGREVVDAIVTISQAGRGVSNDPALFALSRCVAADDMDVRRYALSTLPQVARTGTHLLHFVAYTKQFRGWGRAYKRAVSSWFNDRREQSLAYQLLKYQQRDGYSQRDLLRLAHPKAETGTYNTLYHWVTKGWEGVGDDPHPDEGLRLIWAYEKAKRAENDKEVAALIRTYKLPREAVPTQHLHSIAVWEALLEDMPLEAMTRNLATMTKEGVIKPMGEMTRLIVSRLRNVEYIHKARLHPIKILAALTTYASGKGVKGTNTWTPVREIIDALNDAFYLAFANVEPTNKRILLAIDTSGSMHHSQVNGIPNMGLHTAAGAMALVIANTEPNYHIIGVDTQVQNVAISPRQRLDDVVVVLSRLGGGGTNLALPMSYALYDKTKYDAFIIITDSETWQGGYGHPSQVLEQYRAQVNPDAKIINIQMTATHVTNNDPNDRRALEVAGFDTSVPEVLNSFLRGDF
jgi:60 kDa SS-A/Ro ribonucleoprotein